MFRDEVRLQDALMAVVMIEASCSVAPLLGPVSVLRSQFADDPEAEYAQLETLLLQKLDLDCDDDSPDVNPAAIEFRACLSEAVGMTGRLVLPTWFKTAITCDES